MDKKTISKNLLLRLVAQAEEAEIHKHTKIATDLTNVITKFAENHLVRDDDDEKYEYKNEDLAEDIKVLVWSAAMRVFDYYDHLPDAREIDQVIEDLTENMLGSFENLIEGTHKGKYEPKTPGESEEKMKDEVVEEDEITWRISLPENETINDSEDDEDEVEDDLIDDDDEEEEFRKEE